MDTGLLIFGVIGVLLFITYVFLIIKTAHDDSKARKKEKEQSKNGQV